MPCRDKFAWQLMSRNKRSLECHRCFCRVGIFADSFLTGQIQRFSQIVSFIVIINSKFLKLHSILKHRAPAYSRALHHVSDSVDTYRTSIKHSECWHKSAVLDLNPYARWYD